MSIADVIVINTPEEAKPYEVRAFWVRMPRAGSHVGYSAKCPICGDRRRMPGTNLYCCGRVHFNFSALPPAPPKPPLTERQIKNRVRF